MSSFLSLPPSLLQCSWLKAMARNSGRSWSFKHEKPGTLLKAKEPLSPANPQDQQPAFLAARIPPSRHYSHLKESIKKFYPDQFFSVAAAVYQGGSYSCVSTDQPSDGSSSSAQRITYNRRGHWPSPAVSFQLIQHYSSSICCIKANGQWHGGVATKLASAHTIILQWTQSSNSQHTNLFGFNMYFCAPKSFQSIKTDYHNPFQNSSLTVRTSLSLSIPR